MATAKNRLPWVVGEKLQCQDLQALIRNSPETSLNCEARVEYTPFLTAENADYADGRGSVAFVSVH